MKFFYSLMAMMLMTSLGMLGQTKYPPVETGMLQGPILVPSIAEQIQAGTFVPAKTDPNALGQPKRRLGNKVVPGKGTPETFVDPLLELQEQAPKYQNRAPILTFETTTSTATPSDPTGAVGPNHYIAAWNSAFRIFDKNGNPLTSAAPLSSLFPGNNLGDPIVFYDANADRFVITEFDNSPNGFNVAVCQGPDPVNDGWYVYTTGFGTGSFPDYTKFSVWADTYMVTANIGSSNRVFAIERNEMLNGDPSQFVALPLPGLVTSGFYSPQAFHTTGPDLAPAGTPAPIVYLQDDAWGGVSTDHLKVWSATIDWNNTANSSMSTAQEITTTPFISVFDGGSFSNLSQPAGPDIDAMQATVMNQAQYRRFGSHNSAVFNFVVDTDAGGGELAGVRWYELRQTSDGQPWTIHQEGTYTSPFNGKHAFAASMAMNSNGDIGMGYSTVSNSEMIAIYYTGRLAGDPLNIMTATEDLIAQSTANNTNLRYADYTHLTVDPVDDTFWHVSEYFNSNRRDIVGHFELAPAQPDDLGVTSIDAPVDGPLTSAEDITVTIRNFGSNDITDPEVQYTIDAGTPVVETYSGTIAAGENASYTFSAQADLSIAGNTYTIEARTNLSGDSNPGNDATTKMVTNGLNYCEPQSDCSFGDGITKFVLGDINNDPIPCGTGYDNFTDQSTDLVEGATYTVTVQTGYDTVDELASMWIDFNNNGIFEASEQVFANEVINPVNTDIDIDFTLPTGISSGDRRLRIRCGDTSFNGDLNDPCDPMQYGTTHDYTVNIDGSLGVEDFSISNGELIVVSEPNNQFNISLVTGFEGVASIAIYDVSGKIVAFNNLLKEGDRYNYTLDMSYAASGVYLIQMGDQRSKTFQTAKIIVK